MPTLVEQFIPRRKLLLMLSETMVFTLIMLVGTSAQVIPMSSRSPI